MELMICKINWNIRMDILIDVIKREMKLAGRFISFTKCRNKYYTFDIFLYSYVLCVFLNISQMRFIICSIR